MNGGLLLDTHVAIWIGEGEPIPSAVQQAIETAYAKHAVYVSAISAWEITYLCARNKIAVAAPTETWFARLIAATGFTALPLTPECAIDAALLPDIHRDPADRFLIASARLLDLTLVTRDKAILKYADAGRLKAMVC